MDDPEHISIKMDERFFKGQPGTGPGDMLALQSSDWLHPPTGPSALDRVTMHHFREGTIYVLYEITRSLTKSREGVALDEMSASFRA